MRLFIIYSHTIDTLENKNRDYRFFLKEEKYKIINTFVI